jgi:glycosyltransferase involved in cell wall biosynthesis
MKIVFVQDSLGAGGSERSNAELWYFLRDQGVELKILILEHRKAGVEQEILEAGFDVSFIKATKFLGQSKKLARLIKKTNPDLVHSTLFKSNMRVRFAKLIVKFYHIESLVNTPYSKHRLLDPKLNAKKIKIVKHFNALTQKFGVNHFHANGQTVAAHYREKLNVPEHKLSIIHRGRKPNPFATKKNHPEIKALRAELNPENKLQLINVGRMEGQKAQIIILRALLDLKENGVGDFVFLIAGREGKQTEELYSFVEKNELDEHIKFLGHRSDIYKLLVSSDGFIFPSRSEGLPGALIEAEAAGLPIICSDIDSNLEVVKKDKNGLVFPVDNVQQLVEHLQKLIADQNLREQMGAQSLKIFEERFQLDAIHEQMLEFYKSMLSEKTV